MRKIWLAIIMSVLSFVTWGQTRGLDVVAKSLGGEYAAPGRQVAVFIAIDTYGEWLPLSHPVEDAREIEGILQQRYYLDESIELFNEQATKTGIFKLFEHLDETLTAQDSLFIYYAGHGYLDRMSDTGFWIPQNGGLDRYEQRGWIANSQIRNLLARLKAKHILLVSDSCFSGDILDPNRGALPEIDQTYYRNAFSHVSRQVLSSGAEEAVPDNSEFSRQLKQVLEGNTSPYLDPLTIYTGIRSGVRSSLPLYGDLKETGQQTGGSFLFFLKDTRVAAAGKAAPETEFPGQEATSRVAAVPSAIVPKAERDEKADTGFSGIGITAANLRDGDCIFVSGVFVDGPADRAGIKAGELITAIDGVSTKGMSSDDFAKRCRGATGKDVELTVKPYKYFLPPPRQVRISREQVRPFAFQAKAANGETFDATVGGLRFFADDPKAVAAKDRKYGVLFEPSNQARYIMSELQLSFAPADHERTLHFDIYWRADGGQAHVDLTSRIKPGWDNVLSWRGYSGRGLVSVDIRYNGRTVARGAYVRE